MCRLTIRVTLIRVLHLYPSYLCADYGPFGFLEQFDSDFVPNGSDGSARYSYKRQPEMCQWNLQKFAEALQPLLLEEESEQILRDVYQQTYDDIYNSLFREKLGFLDKRPEDPSMFEDLFTTMENTNADFTDVFVAITDFVENFTNAQSIESKPAIVDELVDKLTSRCAPPASVLAALKRKGRIHKLQMHPNQIAQLWDMLQGNPAEVSRMFSGAPIEVIRNEVEEQKKILDMLITASKQIQELEDLSRPAKQTHDRKLWRSWCDKYVGRLADDIKGASEFKFNSNQLHLYLSMPKSFLPWKKNVFLVYISNRRRWCVDSTKNNEYAAEESHVCPAELDSSGCDRTS